MVRVIIGCKMYRIDVVLRNPFYTMAEGRRNVAVLVKPGGTLKDLIENLLTSYSQFSSYIPSDAENPEEYFIAVREGVILKYNMPLSDGDKIQLLPPISGG